MRPFGEELKSYSEWFPFARIGLLLVGGVVLELVARRTSRRLTAKLGAEATPKDVERRKRGATLMSFATSVARLVIWITVLLSLLAEININVMPIVAGAGVVGAAMAFGAQNIVKDYLAGFFILLENQYTLGDVVTIGAVTGTVENITMRITVLRSLTGALHVVPNGTIQAVTNLTVSWARAVVDVGVAHASRVDEALAVLREVGAALHADPEWRSRLLEAPEVPGVVALTDSAVTLRLQVKVVPEQQWAAKNELMLRIKAAFDAKGIEFPAMLAQLPAAAASTASAA